MHFVAQVSFILVRVWRAVMVRLRYLYYKLALAGLGKGSSITSHVFIDHGYNVYIGSNTNVNQNVLIQASPDAKIVIGDAVHISFGAMLITASLNLENVEYAQGHKANGVTVGDNVWIAAGAVILPGVKIGENSIVGAGAVVNHDVEPNTIAVGIPAKAICKLGLDSKLRRK